MIISFMSLDEGVSSKDLSNDKRGRDPLRQLPDKFSSSLLSEAGNFSKKYVVCTISQLLNESLKGCTIL